MNKAANIFYKQHPKQTKQNNETANKLKHLINIEQKKMHKQHNHITQHIHIIVIKQKQNKQQTIKQQTINKQQRQQPLTINSTKLNKQQTQHHKKANTHQQTPIQGKISIIQQQKQNKQTKTRKQQKETFNNVFMGMIEQGIISEIELPYNDQQQETPQETLNNLITEMENFNKEKSQQTQLPQNNHQQEQQTNLIMEIKEQGIISEIELPYNDQQQEKPQGREAQEKLNNLTTETENFDKEKHNKHNDHKTINNKNKNNTNNHSQTSTHKHKHKEQYHKCNSKSTASQHYKCNSKNK